MTIKPLLLLFLSLSLTLQDQITLDELTTKLKGIAESPIVNLLFIFDSSKMKPEDVRGYLGDMAKSKRGYFDINIFDCQELGDDSKQSFAYCSDENIDKLPSLLFTEPVLNINPDDLNKESYGAKQIGYQGAMEEKKLLEFANPLMKTYSRVLKSMSDLRRFKEDNSRVPRVIYITDKEKISTYYKALTANFRNSIAFAHISSNNTKLCEHLQAKTFPSLILNETQFLEIHQMLPKQIDYMQEFRAEKSIPIPIPADYDTGDELIETAEELEKKVMLVPRYSVVHVGEDKEHPAWKGLRKKLGAGFDYFIAGKDMASQLGVRSTPSIVFYHKSLTKKNSMRTNFNERVGLRDIVDEMMTLIDDFSVSVGSHEEMQRHTSIAFKDHQKVAFLFHQEEVPISFKILSNLEEYKNKLHFYKFKNPDAAVLKQLSITKKLPVLVVMYVSDEDFAKEEIKQMDSENKERQGSIEYRLRLAQHNGALTIDDMKKFIENFLKQANKAAVEAGREAQEEQQDTREEKNLVQIKSPKYLNKYCVKDSCYMLLVDNNPSNSESARRAANFTKSITKRVFDNVVWVDGVCYPQLLRPFEVQVEDLPVLVYINHKFEKYTKLIGRVTAESPNLFVSKVKNNQITYRQYDTLQMEDRNCEEVHMQMDARKFTESELTEEEKEILEEIKEESRKKEAEEAAARNKKKPRRKAKKVENSDEDL